MHSEPWSVRKVTRFPFLKVQVIVQALMQERLFNFCHNDCSFQLIFVCAKQTTMLINEYSTLIISYRKLQCINLKMKVKIESVLFVMCYILFHRQFIKDIEKGSNLVFLNIAFLQSVFLSKFFKLDINFIFNRLYLKYSF